jgi:hypothetical protein
MAEEDEEYSEASNPVKRWDVGEAAGVLGIAGSEGCRGSATHVWIIYDSAWVERRIERVCVFFFTI